MWSVYSGYLYEGVFSEKCIAPGIEVEKQSQVLEEKLAERCKEGPASTSKWWM